MEHISSWFKLTKLPYWKEHKYHR